MKLGEVIKQYRLKNDLSQRQFAKMCGISNGYISMLEEGKHPKTGEAIVPSLAMFKKLSAAMGITVNELMSQADESDVALNLQLFAAPTVEIKTSDLTEGEIALIKVLDKLTDDEQRQVIEFAEFLISKRKNDE